MFAASYPGDCDIVIDKFSPNNTFTLVKTLRTSATIPQNHEQIIDSASLNTAFLNLKANCCAQTNKEKEEF
ncbi:MAG: hypothetical protein LBG52_03430 [Candidatus Peribacteria bacterium]|jgi:hypothetical protein|nr:hypothetical protein [Candidatus Peribacteria bacterium]